MALPCVLWKEHKCSVYDTIQPRRCSEFRCKLLLAYLQGDKSIEECLIPVRRVRELEEEIRNHGGVPRVGTATVPNARDLDSRQRTAVMATIELDVVVYRHFKDRPHDVSPPAQR
jgi:hypothetical protein